MSVPGRGPPPARRRRVIFVNRYYAPDLSATSQMLTGVAEALASDGVDVHVVASRLRYENDGALLARRERLNGVTVWRVATSRFGRAGLPGRAVDYLTFYSSATLRLLRLARRGDLVVAKTDPPLLSLAGALVCLCKGASLVNWLQDLFPEVAMRLAPAMLPRWAGRVLLALRDGSLRYARMNVALGERMRSYLEGRGIDARRLTISENWADERVLQRLPAAASGLRRRLGLTDRFVTAYSGNFGRAHEIETLVEAAERLAGDERFAFLMIGGGTSMRTLEREVARRGLGGFHFLPYQPREALSDALAAGDVHLVSLLPALEGLIVPSKLCGILAAGRPTVFVGDRDGEVARILHEEACGLTVPCGDGAALAAALRGLQADSDGRTAMSLRARQVFETRYTLRASAERWRRLIEAIA